MRHESWKKPRLKRFETSGLSCKLTKSRGSHENLNDHRKWQRLESKVEAIHNFSTSLCSGNIFLFIKICSISSTAIVKFHLEEMTMTLSNSTSTSTTEVEEACQYIGPTWPLLHLFRGKPSKRSRKEGNTVRDDTNVRKRSLLSAQNKEMEEIGYRRSENQWTDL